MTFVFHVRATLAVEVHAENATEARERVEAWQDAARRCDYFAEIDAAEPLEDGVNPPHPDMGTALVYVDDDRPQQMHPRVP